MCGPHSTGLISALYFPRYADLQVSLGGALEKVQGVKESVDDDDFD